MGYVAVLVGPSGSGKTTTCAQLVAQAQQHGFRVAGVISPGVWQHGEKEAIRLRDVNRGEERLLARRACPGESPTVGRWVFLPETLAWGQTVLRERQPTDLLVVDELGPWELLHGQGLMAAFPALTHRAYRLAVVTVRPTLAGRLACRLRAQGLPLWLWSPRVPLDGLWHVLTHVAPV